MSIAPQNFPRELFVKVGRAEMSLTREQLIAVSERMTAEISSPEFEANVRRRLGGRQLPGNLLVEEIEAAQIESLTAWEYDGPSTLTQLKTAVKSFPDQEMTAKVMAICEAEETLLNKLEGGNGHSHDHGHSHGGAPCNHDHSHQQQHGHSHNGVPCHGHGHGHGQANPQMMLAMQMAVQSLSPEQQTHMQRIQMMMMSGQAPTDADKQIMMGIQQHVMAYMATMQNVLGSQGPR